MNKLCLGASIFATERENLDKTLLKGKYRNFCKKLLTKAIFF
jgi:hypothetical protein